MSKIFYDIIDYPDYANCENILPSGCLYQYVANDQFLDSFVNSGTLIYAVVDIYYMEFKGETIEIVSQLNGGDTKRVSLHEFNNDVHLLVDSGDYYYYIGYSISGRHSIGRVIKSGASIDEFFSEIMGFIDGREHYHLNTDKICYPIKW